MKRAEKDLLSAVPEDAAGFCEDVLQFCPDAAEESRMLQDEIAKTLTLGLWWD